MSSLPSGKRGHWPEEGSSTNETPGRASVTPRLTVCVVCQFLKKFSVNTATSWLPASVRMVRWKLRMPPVGPSLRASALSTTDGSTIISSLRLLMGVDAEHVLTSAACCLPT